MLHWAGIPAPLCRPAEREDSLRLLQLLVHVICLAQRLHCKFDFSACY